MQSFSLRCHRPGAAAPPSTFFILSRGNNAGRPALLPNPNCFAFSSEAGDLDRYYWLVYALWETGHFRPFIFGTAIPMIRIGDVRRIIEEGIAKADRIGKVLATLQHLREAEGKLKQQLSLIKDCRSALFRQINKLETDRAGSPKAA